MHSLAISYDRRVIASSGPNWKHQRTFALSKLRDFGFGKRSFESSILEEIENFLNLFESFKGKSFDLPVIIRTSLSNNVMSITVGRRFQYDDPKFRYFVNLLDEVNNTAALSGALNFIPILEKLPGDPFGAKRILEVANEFFDNFFRRRTKRAQKDSGREQHSRFH
ncbi:CYP2K [Mytilus edulis]|uniref:CYP2K n=1 Tax=Mytilus edulis TaxID=6550 RepID=A0A8S3RHC8_MYTED|nr:CYP2K [Mytilus edulis]